MVPAPVRLAVFLLLLVASLLPVASALGDTPRARIGLVLGGGGARGVAHLGVLKVLEEMRVPVDCIAGTSMGALVGGVYASGATVEEMSERLRRIDWDALFVDDPPRTERPYRAKRDDFENLFRVELGLHGWELVLPTGGTSGYKFEFLLREMAARAGNYAAQDFDYLPIPYRAVATDIQHGSVAVLRRGDLVDAMRASMSVPGAIAPVEIGGSLYVDGGLLQNLPVAAAREACADVVIAVNVGSALLPRKELGTALGISVQMLLVLMEQNVRESIASLGPGDVLIAPDLGGFSAGDFAGSHVLVAKGEEAARRRAEALRGLSLPEADYRAWRERVRARQPSPPPVTEVRVATTGSRVNPEVIERELAEVPGIDLRRRPETDFSLDNLHRRLEQVYGAGDFERMDYQMLDQHGTRTVVVRGEEKSWGPDYLKFGLGLASDTYQTRFSVNVSHRAPWVNATGGEWRNDVQLGYRDRFASEFYQPFSNRAGVFVAPRFEWNDRPIVYYLDGRRVGSFQVQTARGHLDLGTQNKFGELRFGVFGGRLKAKEDFGTLTFIPNFDASQAGYTFGAVFDQIDNPGFPRDGLLLSLKGFSTIAAWGSDDEYNRTELLALGARTWDRHTLQLAGYVGDSLHGQLPAYDPFFLGGFLRGSGYRMDELIGERVALARSVYAYRMASLPPQIGSGFYLGGSLEGTRAVLGLDPAADSKVRYSASLFLAADTKLGPAYVAIGQGLNDERPRTLYFMFGTP
jgi:NTE family protein